MNAYFQAWKQNPDLLESVNQIGSILQTQIKKGLDPVINDYCSVVNEFYNNKFLPTSHHDIIIAKFCCSMAILCWSHHMIK